MQYIFLQAEQIKSFSQYGVLGIFAGLMIAIILYLERDRKKTIDEMKARISQLELDMKTQQKEHNVFLETTYKQSVEVTNRSNVLFGEIKEILIRHKF